MYISGTIEKYNFYMFLLSLFTGSLSVGWFLYDEYDSNNSKTFYKFIINFVLIVILISALIIIIQNKAQNKAHTSRLELKQYNYCSMVRSGKIWHKKVIKVNQYVYCLEKSTFDVVLDVLDKLD